MFDTHCHVDLYPAPREIISGAEAAQVRTIAVTNAPSVFPATERLTLGSRFVRPAIGLHPELVVERAGELPLFQEGLARTRYVGEVGLDYARVTEQERTKQRSAFGTILGWCDEAGDKVLTVHSRRAERDVLDAIGTGFRGTVILHWYSGPLALMERAVEIGCYFSVNSAMVRSNRFSALLSRIPDARLLLESDGPFVSHTGRPARPEDTITVAGAIAACRGWTEEQSRRKLMASLAAALGGAPAEKAYPHEG